MPVNPINVIVQAQDLMSSELDGETVMMSLRRTAYFGVEAVGDRIWKLIGQPLRVTELCEVLSAEYDVDPARCEQQVCAFLTELQKEELIRIVA